MFDDLAAYFHENVITTYKEYLNVRDVQTAGGSNDVRSGIIAASALYHFREHLPSFYKKKRIDVVNSCPDYALLGDVVNASKHKILTRGTPQLANANSIEEIVLITLFKYNSSSQKFITLVNISDKIRVEPSESLITTSFSTF